MNRLMTILASSLIALIVASCTAPSESDLAEAPSHYDHPRKLGITGDVSFAELKGFEKEHKLDRFPWTDTYWPTYTKQLADRYLGDEPRGLDQFNLHQFVKAFFEAYESKDSAIISKLSPAEKHDLLSDAGLSALDALDKEAVLADLKVIQDGLDQKIVDAAGDAEAIYKAVKSLINKNKSYIESNSSLVGALPLTMQSWWLWANVAGNSNNRLTANSVMVNGVNINLNKLGEQELRDWSWEGICHGWAPAAIMSAEPKSSVQVKLANGADLLLTEGDLRGFLSKAWADQSPGTEAFIGGRCNVRKDRLKTDPLGRSLDYVLACAELKNGYINRCEDRTLTGYHKERELRLNVDGTMRRIVQVSKSGRPAEVLYLDVDRYDAYGHVYKSLVDVFKGNYELTYYEEQAVCRDTNPMTMHLSFDRILAKGRGMVIDKTRTSQVWNQPVYGYKLTYLNTDREEVDEPVLVSVNDVADLQWRLRAPGTAYLMQVKAMLNWSSENGPHPSYSHGEGPTRVDLDERAPAAKTMSMNYTLEFDSNENLIGGEWGHIPIKGQYNSPYQRSESAPDFLYFYREGSEPKDSNYSNYRRPQVFSRNNINYDHVVKRLLDCANDENLELKDSTASNGFGGTLQYRECSL